MIWIGAIVGALLGFAFESFTWGFWFCIIGAVAGFILNDQRKKQLLMSNALVKRVEELQQEVAKLGAALNAIERQSPSAGKAQTMAEIAEPPKLEQAPSPLAPTKAALPQAAEIPAPVPKPASIPPPKTDTAGGDCRVGKSNHLPGCTSCAIAPCRRANSEEAAGAAVAARNSGDDAGFSAAILSSRSAS